MEIGKYNVTHEGGDFTTDLAWLCPILRRDNPESFARAVYYIRFTEDGAAYMENGNGKRKMIPERLRHQYDKILELGEEG